MLSTGHHFTGPAAVRYPRGSGIGAEISPALDSIEIGKAKTVRHGKNLAFLCFGTLLHETLYAAEKLNATVIDMRFVKPLDEDAILSAATTHDVLITIEENVIAGGAGSGVAEFLNAKESHTPISHLGLPDAFVPHGKPSKLLADCGLSREAIYTYASDKLKAHQNKLGLNNAS